MCLRCGIVNFISWRVVIKCEDAHKQIYGKYNGGFRKVYEY